MGAASSTSVRLNGQKGQFGQTNYSTAKAGIHGFTMALAQEVASKGVTVNTISPGYIGTDMVRAIRPRRAREDRCHDSGAPALGTPEEIASMTSWLASDESGFSTGADFSLNGGLHMGLTYRGPPAGGPSAPDGLGERAVRHYTPPYSKPKEIARSGDNHDASTNRRQPAPD